MLKIFYKQISIRTSGCVLATLFLTCVLCRSATHPPRSENVKRERRERLISQPHKIKLHSTQIHSETSLDQCVPVPIISFLRIG